MLITATIWSPPRNDATMRPAPEPSRHLGLMQELVTGWVSCSGR